MVSSPVSAVAVVSTFITKMETRTATAEIAELELTGLKKTTVGKAQNIELPKYGVPCQIRYKDGREDTAVLSSYVGWHEIGALYAVKEPDYWRYLPEEEKNS